MKISKSLIFFSVLLSSTLFAQTEEQDADKASLRKKSEELKKEITVLNKQLIKAKQESQTSILYITTLKNKIETRASLINNTSKEIALIDKQIGDKQQQINKLNLELLSLKENYAEILVNAYKNRAVHNKMLFVLSAENMQQAYRRSKYIQKYGEFQEKKVSDIKDKQDELKSALSGQKKNKGEKINLLTQQKQQVNDLNSEKREGEVLLSKIREREGDIASQIHKKQKQDRELSSQIKSLIIDAVKKERELSPQEKALAEEKRLKEEKLITLEKLREQQEKIEKQRELAAQKAATEEIDSKRRARELDLARERAEREAITLRDQAAKEAQVKEAEKIAKEQAAKSLEAAKIAKEQAEAEKQAKLASLDAEKKSKELEAAKIAATKASEDVQTTKTDIDKVTQRAASVAPIISVQAFEGNKGNLPWPVEGKVVGTFGKSKHPIIKDFVVENAGVNIAATRGSIAKSVYPGSIKSIMSIPGGNKAVLVNHGGYFTLYANLRNVDIKVGESVSANQPLGTIFTDDNGNTILDFQVWKGLIPQNPALWVTGM